ncbi:MULTISPECIES: hypothetical protein [Protofrankia]|nr:MULTISPECIES: hypothetical protein [Protofrankia]
MGKEPDSDSDYAVLRSSGGFFSRAGFDEILRRFTPGTPSSGSIREALPDALPWVTVSYAPRGGSSVLGIAERTWSDQRDGARRLIATTRYLCVPFPDLAGTPVSYATLYSTLSKANIARHNDGDEPLRIALTPLDPDELAEHIERFGFELVATTAALLLAHRVSVCGGPTGSPDERTMLRLRFLDAVAALLPYGQRSKLVASTWADGGSTHRIRLAFTNHPRPGHTAVYWPPPGRPPSPDPPLDGRCATYFDLLVAMKESGRTVSEIVEHLASVVEPHRTNDPEHAIHHLGKLDSRVHIAQAIHNGTARAEEVRELLREGRIDDFNLSLRLRAVLLLLREAGAEDLETVGEVWPRWTAADPTVEERNPWLAGSTGRIVQEHLWVGPADLETLERFLGLAGDLGFAERVLVDLLDFQTARTAAHRPGLRQKTRRAEPLADLRAHDRQRCATAASLVLEQFRDRRLLAGPATAATDERALTMIAQAPSWLALELIRQMTEPLRMTTAEQIRALLEWLTTSEQLRRVLWPFLDVLDGMPSHEAIDEVDRHENQGHAYLFALLRLARQAGDGPAAKLLPYVLSWLLRTALRLRQKEYPLWVDALRGATPDPAQADAHEATLDLLLLVFGEQPRRPLYLRTESPSISARDYVNCFSESFAELYRDSPTGNSRRTREQAEWTIRRVAVHIHQTGWPQSPQAVGLLLRLLYNIARKSATIGDEAVTATINSGQVTAAEAVQALLDHRPDLTTLSPAQTWLTQIRREHPEMIRDNGPSRAARWFSGRGSRTGRERR